MVREGFLEEMLSKKGLCRPEVTEQPVQFTSNSMGLKQPEPGRSANLQGEETGGKEPVWVMLENLNFMIFAEVRFTFPVTHWDRGGGG